MKELNLTEIWIAEHLVSEWYQLFYMFLKLQWHWIILVNYLQTLFLVNSISGNTGKSAMLVIFFWPAEGQRPTSHMENLLQP